MKSLQKIYLSLGSNQGNRIQQLQLATNKIFESIGAIFKISSVYETSSWGFDSKPFLNCCLIVDTHLSLKESLFELQDIEKALGRKNKTQKGYEDRVIDIDILFFEDINCNTEDLVVPHPYIHDRKFVLKPLAEIAENFVHPTLKKTIIELLYNCKDNSDLIIYDKSLKAPKIDCFFSNYNLVVIEGNIGSGKTSLAKMIARDFNAKLVLERFEDNAFLPKFYEDQERFAFPLEMSFLADRYQQLSEDIAQYNLFTDFIISDYHISKSLTFAKLTLSEEEFFLYRKFFSIIYKEIQKPDLYIYLHQDMNRLLQNIKNRGRAYEQNIQPSYLEKINAGYIEFMKSQPNLNVKTIDVSALDFVNNRSDYLQIFELLKQ